VKLDTQLRAPLGQVAAEAQALADAGMDGAFTFEGRSDVFFPIVEAADVPLDLYTNLAIAFPRSPTHLAHAAWDLAGRTGGRFSLGLGTQVRAHIERRYSATWDKPVSRMRELIEATRAIWACWQDGGDLAYEGEHYQLSMMPPTFRPDPLPTGPPPILVGAVGPDMTRMVAKVADGLLVHPFQTPTFLHDVLLPRIEEGLAAAGRRRRDFTLVCESIVAVWRTDDERDAALAAARGLVAFYGSTPAYRVVLDAEGAGDLQPQLKTLTKEGRWGELGDLIPDDLLRKVVVCGEPEEVGEALVARYGGVADRLGFYTPGQELETDVLATVVGAARRA
jgi:probable F420-dependent oxidoreductase